MAISTIKIIGIYKITSPSLCVYIGQSWDINRRKNFYKNIKKASAQILVSRSILKYGFEKHSFEIIDTFPETITQGELDIAEIYHIENTKKMGIKLLNIRNGGSRGKHSQETRDKLSKIGKERGNMRLGYITPLESRVKMSKAKLGKTSPRKGVVLSADTKNRISLGKMGCMWTDNHKRLKKIIDTKTGIIYRTIAEAASFLEMNRTTLNAMLVGQNRNKTTFKFL